MASELQGALANYYEILGIAEDASTITIKAALQTYTASQEMRLNSQLSMTAARSALNEIVPAIESTLLDDTVRAQYNQQLADVRRKQTDQYEPEDHEGLDDSLRIPFLFNPFDDFDTEIPSYTLRSISMKLDNEWPSAYTWITDTSDETHGFVSYLTFVANRKRLADRIEQIIVDISPENKERIDPNEGIERCINLLNPQIERPRVSIHNLAFDGKRLDAGNFITDLPAQSELILGHDDMRGCAFGSVESQTSWLTLDNGQPRMRFALMPVGTEPEIGPSEVTIPLHFAVGNLARNTDHTAHIIIRMENQVSDLVQPIQVQIHIKPLPPRVIFQPNASEEAPLWIGITHRGVATQATITSHNLGDEALVPLVARISTKDPAASVRPYEFHTDEPITLMIDTSKRPYGEKYIVAFEVEYVTPEAKGPTTIYVQGEILPTIWQSIVRTRSVDERLGVGCLSGIGGLAILAFSGTELAAHASFAWLFYLALPILLIIAMRQMVATAIVHRQRAGKTEPTMEHVPAWVLWGIPLAVGLVLALLSTFIPNATSSLTIDGLAGFLLGMAFGFLLDPGKTHEKI